MTRRRRVGREEVAQDVVALCATLQLRSSYSRTCRVNVFPRSVLVIVCGLIVVQLIRIVLRSWLVGCVICSRRVTPSCVSGGDGRGRHLPACREENNVTRSRPVVKQKSIVSYLTARQRRAVHAMIGVR